MSLNRPVLICLLALTAIAMVSNDYYVINPCEYIFFFLNFRLLRALNTAVAKIVKNLTISIGQHASVSCVKLKSAQLAKN